MSTAHRIPDQWVSSMFHEDLHCGQTTSLAGKHQSCVSSILWRTDVQLLNPSSMITCDIYIQAQAITMGTIVLAVILN